ncbi:hypothetical protein AGOR_G00217990 [Albula goreensis]|uniref:Uncharacterized protein n=1 Tax=Albula goreensis TaxID=1534307 RepID=A0A8T3CLB6_9TELE|nr:hypothetical protein AGOR_G00217990 [Albula goreensis]
MAIKDEPADPVPVTTPIAMTMELGKRRSKPPIKLLDPGFLFDFGGVKREEESVDICLTRSVSQGPGRPRRAALGTGAPHRFDREQPRLRGVVSGPMPKKRVTTRLRGGGGAQGGPHRPCPANSGKPKAVGNLPKKRRQQLPLQSRRLRLLESTRRVRWRQLRGVAWTRPCDITHLRPVQGHVQELRLADHAPNPPHRGKALALSPVQQDLLQAEQCSEPHPNTRPETLQMSCLHLGRMRCVSPDLTWLFPLM